MGECILAVDQGTTGTTVLATTADGHVLGRGYREHPQSFPRPGWVEHDAEAIWQTVLDCTGEALSAAALTAADVAAVGITNQRETVVAWSAASGAAIGPTIVWQDRRTAADCAQLRADGHAARIRELAGLPTDPYFSATKVAWLLREHDGVRAAATSGDLRLGTIDAWLVHRMTGGGAHATDASNAARTMLYDIHRQEWSSELCELFGVDPAWLPRVADSAGHVADCDPGAFAGIAAPICGIAGDQQSALFGQACLHVGQAKATYGTGAFVLVNSGDSAPVTESLIATVAWQLEGRATYTLEGSVFTAGASVQWLRDGVGFFGASPEVRELAASVPDSGGVVLVPAFAGLGAPHWDPDARASLLGVTRGTTRAHIARATLEAVAFRVRDVLEAMRAEGTDVSELRVDGGMAANDVFLQVQADIAGVPVTRPANVETTALGATFLAGLGSGLLGSLDDVAGAWTADRTFEPDSGAREAADVGYARFTAAVAATRAFAAAPAAEPAAPRD